MFRQTVKPLSLASVFVLSMTMVTAQIPAPGGEVLLTVTGEISQTNQEEAAVFDRAMLEAMPATEFTTRTIWTEGPTTFRGVELSSFLDRIGAEGSDLEAYAFNDYMVYIPFSDAVDGGPIIAYEMNGNEMTRRGKGPLWIVYPYDTHPNFQTETTYSRSIWQLVRLHVVE